MGIRFHCPNGHKLHVKAFLAGKRGICPECGVRVEIPQQSVGLGELGRTGETGGVASQGSVWFVRTPTGDQFGPADTATFQDWVKEGRVAPDCLVWQEGWPDWRPAADVLPGMAATLSTGTSAPPAPPPSTAPAPAFSIEVDPDPSLSTGRKAKRRSRKLVFLLMVACLVLLVPLIYVVTVKT